MQQGPHYRIQDTVSGPFDTCVVRRHGERRRLRRDRKASSILCGRAAGLIKSPLVSGRRLSALPVTIPPLFCGLTSAPPARGCQLIYLCS
ncbi:hypothetical protein AAFF_G00059040 [Aldrovandia affinis]|uniref:Uncharacterized protein n=1 Tax=Aldrovandia affinis TaxID=143900 RepID=A0AAD7S0F3_9TELE|nr:hypothetical protein AAFF_G00059040 [Aldrovandia affinis]